MGRRTLSPEQQAATQARRDRFATMARELATLTDDQRASIAAGMTATTIEGRTLSPRNACLVALQNPAATLVGGFQQWRAHGRTVRRGEHGIQIWAPTRPRATDGATADDDSGPRFITITIFDVSQTDQMDGAQ